ncbi:NUDIX hydrolase [Aurantiacibacter sp. MUD11]|uniref:NUDIX hydrolase n=1 Tax=Aurantiacibacter sp. MUD11 TaxID=3003265 RepID=UPI0022AA390F|nr:NUDIX hydrolase [Aurantiacibacter sp. MUD11]WAT17632.1 NUDIX hydrolase [Aurantiacibacter sp. MUD11]
MLHLMPAWAHRAALPFGHVLRKSYLSLFRPRIAGVCVFIEDDAGRVLFLRQSYGSRAWTIPAGGARRDEDPEVAIRREVYEELGCELHSLEMLHQCEERLYGAPQLVSIFAARALSEPRPDNREVIAVEWFSLDRLPSQLTGQAMRRLPLLQQR